ncbi:MAG: hypothetical protein LBO65_08590 [Spirochaetaceae bacterium]|jgi:hypothetical protein|nr:hypothetical protein [Spirochaetaceae bacterium]
MKSFFAPLGGLCLLVLGACSGQITGQVAQDASGALQIQAGLAPNMVSLISTFRSFNSNGAQTGPILNAAAIAGSLQTAPGVKSAVLRNSGQERLEGTVAVSHVGELFSAGGGFIRYEAPSGTAPGRISIRLDRTTGPRILSVFSSEAVDYLSALSAPAATGEALTKKEYLELVESIYGKAIADEIAASRIRAVISFPGQIRAVTGGTFSGREARFDIPLPDILVLETPLNYEVVWGR